MAIDSQLSNDGKVLTIKISDRFDFSTQHSFRAMYKDSPDSISDYVLDMSQTDYMDSSALGMLLLLKQYADERKSNVSIKNASKPILKILEVANFNKLFSVS